MLARMKRHRDPPKTTYGTLYGFHSMPMDTHAAARNVGRDSKVRQPQVLNLAVPKQIIDGLVECCTSEPGSDRVGKIPQLTPRGCHPL